MKHPLFVLMTHDLQCAFSDLAGSANRFVLPRSFPADRVHGEMMAAAVRFAIQLAIDQGDRDPGEMRKLEQDLIDKLSLPE